MRRSLLRLAEHASHNSHHGGVGSPPHVHGPAAIHRNAAIFLGATTTFYVLYKAYHEGAVFLVQSDTSKTKTNYRD
jgi:hypothetical protein